MDILQHLGSILPALNSIASPRQLLQIPIIAPFFHTGQPDQHRDQEAKQQYVSGSSCQHPQLSCPTQLPPGFDECCLNAPSGHFLSTQFWDTAPALGANDSWTLHGLWPDYCQGGFDQYCDDARSKSQDEIEEILKQAGESTHPHLLDFMSEHWLSYDLRNSHLWTHEWNKHGTCISTLKPKCYGDGDGYGHGFRSSQHQSSSSSSTANLNSPADILDYFQRATSLYSSLDTFKTLEKHGIVPSHDVTYKLSDIQDAIKSSSHGHDVTLKCNPRHELQEIWYHFLVRGPLRHADPSSSTASLASIFVPTEADGQISNCPAVGVKYIPKGLPAPPKPPPGHGPGPDPTPFVGKGHLQIHVLSGDKYANDNIMEGPDVNLRSMFQGCLIRPGSWYTFGACATYTARTDVKETITALLSDESSKQEVTEAESIKDDDQDQLFTLQSSFAPCAILEESDRHGKKGQFICAKHLPLQSIFSASNSTSDDIEEGSTAKVLSYKGQTVFYADHVPGRFEKVSIFADDDNGQRSVKVEVHWTSTER